MCLVVTVHSKGDRPAVQWESSTSYDSPDTETTVTVITVL